jgi:FlaG/FlaF family flagellin (archaellin)
MVAITVILAAVIASFVLGLGNTAGEVAPTASFSFDYDNDPGNSGEGVLTISHDGGDPIRHDELYVRGDGIGCSGGCTANLTSTGNWVSAEASGSVECDGAMSTGTRNATPGIPGGPSNCETGKSSQFHPWTKSMTRTSNPSGTIPGIP